MIKQFISVLADVNCEWEGLNPSYRVYVNEEMFTERTWLWTDEYLEEELQIYAPPGEYQLRWELVWPHLAKLTVRNIRINNGHGKVLDNQRVRIKGFRG